MKELSIEEKAHRYDEAIEIAKKINNEHKAQPFNVMLKVFPELAESEDERIKKELLNAFQESEDSLYMVLTPHRRESFIAWLEKQCAPTEDELEALRIAAYEPTKNWSEKLQSLYEKLIHHEQGEQKPVAKYKVGDTIYYNSFGRLVSFVIANIVEDGTDNPMYEDKDGNSVFQNDIVEQKPTNKIEPKFKVGDKIQYSKGCGTIMTIEKIENGEYIFANNMGHTTIEWGNKWYLVELKPTWNEEDERIYKSIIYSFAHNYPLTVQQQEFIKSLKDRYTWKPSDEQMAQLKRYCPDNRPLTSLYEQLKKLRGE